MIASMTSKASPQKTAAQRIFQRNILAKQAGSTFSDLRNFPMNLTANHCPLPKLAVWRFLSLHFAETPPCRNTATPLPRPFFPLSGSCNDLHVKSNFLAIKQFPSGILRLILLASVISLLQHDANACTEIFIAGSGTVNVSARNFDFFTDGNGIIRFSPAGTPGQSQYTPANSQPLKWTSKYAALTFNLTVAKTKSPAGGNYQAGVDGINQAGLKVGTYFLAPSIFPENGIQTTIDIGSLMQYLLDNFKTVDEALADLSGNRYRVTSMPTGLVEIKLHMYLHDLAGGSAIIEFSEGKLKITNSPAIPVLANSFYDQSVEHLKQYTGFGGAQVIPGTTESFDRFVRGSYYWKNLPPAPNQLQAVNYGFSAIQLLTVSPGFSHGGTRWTIVTDLENRRVCFRTLNNPMIASIDLDKLGATVKGVTFIDILRTDLAGDITGLFAGLPSIMK
jgi:choloylglycine hydrolase